MKYGIWNNTEKPVGIVQIVCDSNKEIEKHENFAKFLNKNRYLVYGTDAKNALDFMNMMYNLPVFLIGIGNAGKTVQNITRQSTRYNGGISIMARTPITQKIQRTLPFRFGGDETQKIPLMIIGGWDAVKQAQPIVNTCNQGDSEMDKITLLIYPEIRAKTAFEMAQNEILGFLNQHR